MRALSPLLEHLPTHLGDKQSPGETHTTVKLSRQELQGRAFCSADVTFLYTNINIRGCMEDVVNLVTGHKDLFGLNLNDFHDMVDSLLTNSYLTFDNHRYL